MMNSIATTAAPKARRRSLYPDFALLLVLIVALICAIQFNPFSHEKQTAIVLSLLIAVEWPSYVLAVIERFRPSASPRKSLKNILLHIQIMLFYTVGAVFVGGALGLVFEAIKKALHLKGGLINLETPLSSTIAIVLGFIGSLFVGDFLQYWVHRLQHKSKFLWQGHKVHHMDPEFDALTGQRQNWTTIIIYFVLLEIPTSILFKFSNFDPLSLGLINGAIVSLVYAFLYINHSSMRIQFGRASVLLVSTQIHRIHHSRLPQHRDRNFANWFPIWDILFGTYYHPARDEFPPTGVEEEKEIRSLWESQILTLQEWWKMFRAWHRRRAGVAGVAR